MADGRDLTGQPGAGAPVDEPRPEVEHPAPLEWEADVVLKDGTVAHIRAITPADADRVRAFHSRQSAESIYLRFFAPLRELSDKDVYRFTHVDHHDRVALVATLDGEIIGIGRYDRVDPTSAEVAFNISDHYQGKGIGSVMLEHLAAIAQEFGITRFTAEVLPQNRKMLTVFKEAGYEVSHHIEDGVVEVSFFILPTEQSKAVQLSREHRAEARSVRTILFPERVAVIGASRRDESIGALVMSNILAAGYQGELYPIHPEADQIQGVRAYRSIREVPGPVDLAVVVVPAAQTLEVVKDCRKAGVKALLVLSSGFAEAGDEGVKLQEKLRKRVRRAGMRIVGPNSFGLINNDPSVRLNASLAPVIPGTGRLGLFAQSGALGVAVLASAARRGLGISVFASAGNRVDVSGNDLMQYWIDDPETDTVGLYLESMGNPRKFSRIARHLASVKPVIAVSSGVSSFAAPPGHRTRTTNVPPQAFRALLRQAGVIRVENVHQLFDVAQLTLHQPMPRGDRVAIVGNSDALGALSGSACLSWGLKVTHGPVSLLPQASAEEFAAALDAAFADPEVDSVVAAFIPPLVTLDEEVSTAVRTVVAKYEKPCVATFLGMRGVDGGLDYVQHDGVSRSVPSYGMPEDGIRALNAVTRYAQWRSRDRGTPVAPVGIDRARAEGLIDAVLAEHPEGRALRRDETRELLSSYGIRVWPALEVTGVDAAVEAAEELTYPVILKSTSPLVRHQPGLVGVRGDLVDADAVRDAHASLTERLGPLDADRFVVQRMAVPGVSCVLKASEDPLFGPVVSFSVAGPPTELLDDVAYRIPPLTDVDVTDLIDGVKAAPLLAGHRGAAPVHRAALSDLIARLSVLADNHPDLSSVELNPVNAWTGGVDVLGADIVVRPALVRKDPGRRRMT
ncbi:multidrug ABC transporter permease [Intrasporangium oryzae NRRL B-24470]|uniref:Multidrug ABC transporter permease n=1 Tax=Intrasporangium oryzae NRRL B-24470 TaxID=1386089 RepID=W9G6P8_9MICO|nr:bifunctional GNAT family N-acetyltransferase/acetate--CoA ligase family protein [Intrasporangium oryzae]EWT01866.1 multidrug ABC transporter permease [Intrasporangium oryzae NRRL B-24470]